LFDSGPGTHVLLPHHDSNKGQQDGIDYTTRRRLTRTPCAAKARCTRGLP